MSFEDYLLNLVLVATVVRQLRGRKLTPVGLLWPVPLVVWAGVEYLSALPKTAADWTVVLSCAAIGALLGGTAARLTRIDRQGVDALVAVASGPAAVLWVLGVGARLAFGVFATHGGGPAIARVSAAHDITAGSTWTTALLLMSLSEVLVRALVLGLRGRSARRSHCHEVDPEQSRGERRDAAIGAPDPLYSETTSTTEHTAPTQPSTPPVRG